MHFGEDDGLWHMHVAQFVRHCGFDQWDTNSRIVHAVSNAVDGTYAVKNVVWPVWSHNPTVVQSPDDGTWVMTFVANTTLPPDVAATCDPNGTVLKNSSLGSKPVERNYISTAKSLNGPWSTPLRIDAPFDASVPPFPNPGPSNTPNRNTNLALSLHADGSMVGLWRRCCIPPPTYTPPGGGGASVIFAVRASDWRNVSTWEPSKEMAFPELRANGFEDPFVYADASGVYHAMFHSMVGGWHRPEYNNTLVGAHAFSDDGGRSWVSTGVAFDLNITYADGSSRTFVQRERPHVVLDRFTRQPRYLVSAVTYSLPTLKTCTIVQSIRHGAWE